ncbi:uncharacterized protein LOC118405630 isoform X2 [Branchiostoma floridae]|nr:uncharacterized protein LOC118405630 isoform X2 [Branchiostoma floridae]
MARILLVLVLAAVQTLAEEGLFGFDGLDGELAGFLDDANKITLSGVTGELPGEEDHVVLQCDVMSDDKDFPEKELKSAKETRYRFVDFDLPQRDQELLKEQQAMLLQQQAILIEQQDTLTFQQSTLINQQEELNVQQKEVVTFMEKSSSMDVCQTCAFNEYCSTDIDPPYCFPCRKCPKGYRVKSECTRTKDAECEDIDECSQSSSACPMPEKCVNTPGGFLCIGELSTCTKEYFFNIGTTQCEPCTQCRHKYDVMTPCSAFADAVCFPSVVKHMSDLWRGNIKNTTHINPDQYMMAGITLPLRSLTTSNDTFVVAQDSYSLSARKPGVLWMDYNFAVKHSCINYIQMTLKSPEMKLGLSGARIEEAQDDVYHGASLGASMVAEENEHIRLELKSNNRYCFPNHFAGHQTRLKAVADDSLSGPLSVLWLSNEMGAVTMTARTRLTTYHSKWVSLFEHFKTTDPFIINLNNNRRFTFGEAGIVKFTYNQAIYSIGEQCQKDGFSVVPRYLVNDTEVLLSRRYKTGITRRDTTISISGVWPVEANGAMVFQINSPQNCQTRFYGDRSAVGVLNMLWLPAEHSAAFAATLSKTRSLYGAQARVLEFKETQNSRKDVFRMMSNGFIKFMKPGRININYHQKMIHSCDYAQLTAYYVGSVGQTPAPIVQQVLGRTDASWDGVSMSGSYAVEADSQVYLEMSCKRGRINKVAEQEWSTLYILWVKP